MKIITTTLLIAIDLFLSVTGYSQVIKRTYAIKNVQTGLLLRIKDASRADGTPLVAYWPVNWKCVTWDFNYIEGQTYLLKNLFTAKTIQSLNNTAASGDALKQQPINNSVNQQYEFIPVERNVYLIRLKGTDLYVTPSDKNGTVNSSIILSKKEDSKLQQWTIYEQHPEI